MHNYLKGLSNLVKTRGTLLHMSTFLRFASSNSGHCQYREQFRRQTVSTSMSSLRNSVTASLRLPHALNTQDIGLEGFSLDRTDYRGTFRRERTWFSRHGRYGDNFLLTRKLYIQSRIWCSDQYCAKRGMFSKLFATPSEAWMPV